MEALGLIETKGLVGAIVAADTAVKSANVTLLNAEKIRGGYVTVQLDGDVGAVKAAVEAATEAIQPFGTLVSSHVIPRMHTETSQLITIKIETTAKKHLENEPKKPEEIKQIEQPKQPKRLEKLDQVTKINEKEEPNVPLKKHKAEEKQTKDITSEKRKKLEKMTVNELRKLVREKNIMKDDVNKIKYTKKAELVNRILNENQND